MLQIGLQYSVIFGFGEMIISMPRECRMHMKVLSGKNDLIYHITNSYFTYILYSLFQFFISVLLGIHV